MRIAVYGTGGVGGYFGGRLANSGADVTFIARGQHLQAIRHHGLKVDSRDGDFLIHPAQATNDPAEVGPVDLIIVGVKAWQVSAAAAAMQPMVGPTTIVLPLQNGVEASTQLASVLGRGFVIGGLCRIVSYVVGPGHIRHAGFEPSVTFGELDNRASKRVKLIHDAFTKAGVKASIAADINVALWAKFLFISSFSGVGALTGKNAGEIRSDAPARELLKQAMEEVLLLAQARGVNLQIDAVEKALASVAALPPDGTSSMQRDIAAGKPSELDSQTGSVVRLADEAGLAVPTHRKIYDALRPLEIKARALQSSDAL
ncbi:MAG TPA: 2-dehydropantoate 2-reductase [Pyrinomonadaceae bacterium]|nr:2-dehydropantoate 2-reductase [Pyrinomonadaceae bacterium]